ncbi:MAG: DUF1761 domain-containing protein [Bacteriovoracaceae bacterium]|jgi:hypothetical protein|nr:DUF1761 domain-containing protein [Bacteriovoracaceae bacterium]
MDLANVLGAALVGFFISLFWRASFSKAILKGWKVESSNHGIKSTKYLLVSFIGALWCSYGVFLLTQHIPMHSYAQMAAYITCLWLFVLVGINAKHYLDGNISKRVVFINFLGDLIQLLIMGFIIF